MENNHLTYFKIENFKKFDSLEVNDIGQFNLIVGDNNVGKTCLLEALLFDEKGEVLISNFHMGLSKRGMDFKAVKIPYDIDGRIVFDYEFPQGHYFTWVEQNKNQAIRFTFHTLLEKNKSVSISPISIGGNKQLDKSSELKVTFTNHVVLINDKTFNIYNYDENILDFPMISFNDSPLEEETIKLYESLKTKNDKKNLIEVLKIIDRRLVGIDFRENFEDLKSVFLISYEDKEEYFPLNTLGDGFKRIFYIVLKMLSLKGKRILIDEIEIGIHYSKMKDFWVNIMKVCKELDVQLFATTHSQECTETYIEASNLLNYNNEIRLVKLEESTNKDKIYASTFTYNQISAGLDSNVELRG
ncbi:MULTISPECIES: AAA family ATPase [Flavobacterium]|uniref:AAA family ATPase n=1 Tax=Flavobacterium TaxID=237 RepID=UPI00188B7462|nr:MULTISPECIES: ATP-binding protein [Flavobacterium]MBF4473002.1 AAA family ATPase [Flavobacterium sp. HJJ]